MSTVVEVTCPWCGVRSVVDPARRESGDFCPGGEAPCDFPLFWAVDRWPAAAAAAEPDDVGEASLRRQPGTAGRAWVAGLPCPACREPNDPERDDCARCGAALRPVAVVAPPPPPPAPVAPPAPAPWWRTWWALWWALVALAAVVATADVTVLLLRR
ncbi:MAG TPA: hypothetical protein VNA20_04590 [Frankiaceae bacterium]|nr:hypothetical protein [Frankiaceae bacterium]